MSPLVIFGIALGLAMDSFAVAVGFSFALLGVKVWDPSVVIGLVSAAVTVIGMRT